MKELTIPPAAVADDDSVELLRAWVADGGQWVSLNPHLYRHREFEEEWAWGLFLADTIRHLARAIGAESGKDERKIIKGIRKAFDGEIKKPTTAIRGGYLEDEA